MQKPIEVSIETVKAVVCKEFKLAAAPIHVTLYDLGLNYADLAKLKDALRKAFNLDIRIQLSDTISVVTNRLQ
jgi:hypothetical protein